MTLLNKGLPRSLRDLYDRVAALEASSGGGVAWGDITGKPAVIAAGADQAAARSAIGAGTSNLAIGTTASTAAAGNHSHTGAQIALTGYTIGTEAAVAAADTVNAAIGKLEARIVALETP